MEQNTLKASELRIGNLVLDPVRNKIGSIDEIKRHPSCERDYDYLLKVKLENALFSPSEYFDYFKPIPLTEEWLVRFGFEKKNSFEFESPCTVFYIEKSSIGDYEFCKKPQYDEFGWLKTIKYVHQLQNLYFALIGEELTIK